MSEQPVTEQQPQPDFPAPSPAPPAPSPAEPVEAAPVAEAAAPAEDAEIVVTQPVPPEVTEPRGLFGQAAQVEDSAMPVGSTSNVTPILPAGAQAAAARAHALIKHWQQVGEKAIEEIEKYVPQPVLQAAETEIAAFLRSVI